MLDSIYQMTFKLLKNHIMGVKTVLPPFCNIIKDGIALRTHL